MLRVRAFRTVALLAVLGATTAPVRAAEPVREGESSNDARVAELNETGAKHYAKRNYRLAIESFIEAYAIDHDPNLLFNIARCYEELGETAAAIEKYQAFIAAPGADADGRVRAEASLRSLKQLKGTSQDPRDTARPGDAAPAAAADPPAEESPEIAPYLKWGALGGGVLLAGLGATFYYLGAQDHAEVTSAAGYGDPNAVHPLTRSEAQALVDSGDTKKLIGGIGMGVGGALLVTSVVLFVTGGKPDTGETSGVAFGFAPGPGDVSAALSGRF
jgi:tetratricopeptide (TPR) repeat protein